MLLANAFDTFILNTFFCMVIMICWVKWMLDVHDKNGEIKDRLKDHAKRGFFSLLKRWLK